MPKAIIFGVSGQDGFYLADLLSKSGIEVIGVSRSEGRWLQGSVADREFTEALIKKEQPAFIFQLAAISKVDHELLFEHQATVVNGTLHILEAVKKFSPQTKVFITGSGLQFKNTGNPISSEDEFFAGDAYSLARIQSVQAARYFRSKGIKTYVGYLFHHDSPLRTAHHMNRKIVDAAKEVAAGRPCTLSIGDVSVEKEFGFAGDIVNGIFHLANQDDIFEACIGTGKAYSIEKWLELCFSSVSKEWKEHVQINTGFVPAFNRLVSNPTALQAIGWKAAVEIDELSTLMMKSTE